MTIIIWSWITPTYKKTYKTATVLGNNRLSLFVKLLCSIFGVQQSVIYLSAYAIVWNSCVHDVRWSVPIIFNPITPLTLDVDFWKILEPLELHYENTYICKIIILIELFLQSPNDECCRIVGLHYTVILRVCASFEAARGTITGNNFICLLHLRDMIYSSQIRSGVVHNTTERGPDSWLV